MKPAPFDYVAPDSLEEALELLAARAEDAKILAGGQSLVPVLNFRLAQPALLVDINRIPGLDFVRAEADGGLAIGALVRHARLEREPLVAARAPLLAEAVPFVAHPQIRNRGTLGGSLAHADPAAELPAVALALDARFRLVRRGGERWVDAADFFTGLFSTALAPGELLAEVRLPPAPPGSGVAFLEVARRHGDYAQAGVAARVELDGGGRCRAAKLVYLSVGEGPVVARRAAALLGASADPDSAIDAAARIAAGEEIGPVGDIHASAAFKRHLVAVLTRRALRLALARGSGAPMTARAVRLEVNGRRLERAVEPRLLLSDFLRHELGLTGTHVGCEHGVCGVCTVLFDGEPVRSCLMLAVQADGHRVETVESLSPAGADGDALHPLQEAFRASHALQCGFCTPGILMSMVAFLRDHPDPTEADVRLALSGNLCRCTGYQHIVDAVLRAARTREGGERMAERARGFAAETPRLDAWQASFGAREAEVHAFVAEPGRFARVRAAWGRPGPLAGCLLGVKDIFRVDGLPTRAGSRLPEQLLAGAEGPCVAALRAAGAAVAGKTATTEFAYFAPGPTRNPAHLDHTPGGSSSGSAAAVAAGLCDLALGTQTIGSIGRPAAYCGIVGFKPSYERISRDGVIPLAPSADHVGLLAADVLAIARAAPVAIADWRAVASAGAKPRLGIPVGAYFDALSPAGVEHFGRLRAALERAGYELTEVEVMPDFPEIAERHRRLVAAEAAQVHADWFAAWGELYAAATAALIERGRGVPAAEAERSRAARLELRARLDGALAAHGLDLWLSPPATGPAPRGLESTGDPIFNLPWTHAGVPTLVVPAGRSAPRFGSALPMGAQLAARFGADEELLAWGARLAADLAGRMEGTAP